MSRRASLSQQMTRHALLLCVLAAAPCFATVYVDLNAPAGTNDGSSWADACLTIQAGLDASASGEEIWVADGTYLEAVTLGVGDVLYGGFEGYEGAEETDLTQRDWEANETIIDGSTADGGGPADHVVILFATTNARLDGLTITGGYADGSSTPGDSAGGVFLFSADATNAIANCTIHGNRAVFGGGGIAGAYSSAPILNCTITANEAYDGAGLAWAYGTLTITDCTVSENIAGQSGGGISGVECDSATITRCTVTANEAPEGGAGIGFYDTPLTITDCDITDNTGTTSGPGAGVFLEGDTTTPSLAMTDCLVSGNTVTVPGTENEGDGGGVHVTDASTVTLADCTLRNNAAETGGGFYCKDVASVTLEGCTVDQNTGTNGMGGAAIGTDTVSITKCTFDQNSAISMGGASLHANTGDIVNSIFSRNSASFLVGGLHVTSPNTPGISILNCTFSGNNADTSTGGLACETPIVIRNTIFEGNTHFAIEEYGAAADPLLENCLFYDNPHGAYFDDGSPPAMYLDIQIDTLNTDLPEATGNINGDPAFIDQSAGDLHLSMCSAAIDEGATVSLTDDKDGNPRPVDIPGIGASAYDIGAYEFSASSVFTQQPQGARLYSDDSHTFTIAVVQAGCTVSYQWKWDDGSKAVHDVGGDAPALDLPTVTGLAGDYWCEVTCGGATYASDTAVLAVEDHLAITGQPQGADKSVGQSHAFSVVVTGGYAPLTYTWKKDGDTVGTGPQLTLDPLELSDTGAYSVEIQDDNGDVVASAAAQLNVDAGLPATNTPGLALLTGLFAIIGAFALRRPAIIR